MADDKPSKQQPEMAEEVELLRRRDFLKSLRKWSPAVIGGLILGALAPGSKAEAGWINSRGGWVNGGGGGLGQGAWRRQLGQWRWRRRQLGQSSWVVAGCTPALSSPIASVEMFNGEDHAYNCV